MIVVDENTPELLQRLCDLVYWGPQGPAGGNHPNAAKYSHGDSTLRMGAILAELLAVGAVPARGSNSVTPAADERLMKLARTFPTLESAPGVEPWNPKALDKWAAGPVPSSGAFHAARFVLSVWNSTVPWSCGPFELFRALQVWDEYHRAAFADWAVRPWQP